MLQQTAPRLLRDLVRDGKGLQPDVDSWQVDDVLSAMRTIGSATRKHEQDGECRSLYWFNAFYRQVTVGVHRELQEKDLTPESRDFLRRLDVMFYRRYYQAICGAAEGKEPPAWRPLFDGEFTGRLSPIQCALLGVHAHILYDMPVAVAQTVDQGMKAFPDRTSPQYGVYDELNQIIFRVMVRTLKSVFTEGRAGLAFLLLPPPMDELALTYIKAIRDEAYWKAMLLFEAGEGSAQFDALSSAFGDEVCWYNAELLRVLDVGVWLRPKSIGGWMHAIWHARPRNLQQLGREVGAVLAPTSAVRSTLDGCGEETASRSRTS